MTAALIATISTACLILLWLIAAEIQAEHVTADDEVERITGGWQPAHLYGVAPGTSAQIAPARVVLTQPGQPGRHRAGLLTDDTGQLDLTELDVLLDGEDGAR